jgi:hypothetical protein
MIKGAPLKNIDGWLNIFINFGEQRGIIGMFPESNKRRKP